MVTEYLISELARPLCFHADTFCGDASWALAHTIAWKQSTVIWNLQTSLFQLLSNIPVYKNHHVYIYIYIYIFFCKVLSVVFKASSTILPMSKGPLVIWIVHERTSYVLYLPLRDPLPPPLLSRTSWKFFISFCFTHANWLFCLLLAHFDHSATGNCVKSPVFPH